MRVISGKYKGRTLYEFKGKDIRPTGEKAREALFDILREKFVDAEVLDLFAGTGAVGIEALSRGAKHVVMNDISRESVALITKNCEKVKCTADAEIMCMPALFALNKLGSAKKKFDVIFLDPPYNTPYGEEAIEIIVKKGLLDKDGVIILEKPSTDKKRAKVEELEIFDERRYGLNSFIFYRFKEEENE